MDFPCKTVSFEIFSLVAHVGRFLAALVAAFGKQILSAPPLGEAPVGIIHKSLEGFKSVVYSCAKIVDYIYYSWVF